MFASLTTKLALKKVGLPTNILNFTTPTTQTPEPPSPQTLEANNPKTTSNAGTTVTMPWANGNWAEMFSVKNLPLSVQPWLAPPPPPIPVADLARVGDPAPMDRDRKLALGGGKMAIVVFLRCVGCAFAQKTFINLRTLANKYPGDITCIAVSHSSETATKRWLDLLGGAWAVQVVIDEDRAVYAAWGLGVSNAWYVLNPATQVSAWKEKGWLGEQVASSLKKTGWNTKSYATGGTGIVDVDDGPNTVMGNKWQTSGAWAVDGNGLVVWGGKAAAADDVMDLDAGVRALGLI